MAIILLAYRPSLLIIGTGCTLGIAPRTKETLPDFREWCRVTRHPRVFRGLTGCQQTPRFWGVTCMRHLANNFMTRFKDKLLKNLVCRVALATTERKFNKLMATIGRICSEAQ